MTQDLFYMINKFAKVHSIKEEVKLYLVDNQLQESDTGTCGFFQLFIYANLFLPLKNIQILNEDRLTVEIINKLLNNIFTLDKKIMKVE